MYLKGNNHIIYKWITKQIPTIFSLAYNYNQNAFKLNMQAKNEQKAIDKKQRIDRILNRSCFWESGRTNTLKLNQIGK